MAMAWLHKHRNWYPMGKLLLRREGRLGGVHQLGTITGVHGAKVWETLTYNKYPTLNKLFLASSLEVGYIRNFYGPANMKKSILSIFIAEIVICHVVVSSSYWFIYIMIMYQLVWWLIVYSMQRGVWLGIHDPSLATFIYCSRWRHQWWRKK